MEKQSLGKLLIVIGTILVIIPAIIMIGYAYYVSPTFGELG